MDSTDFERSMKRAVGDLGNFRSDVLQLSATLASAFGFKALTFDFSKQNDQLRQMASMLGVTTNALYGLDEAGKSFGAQEGEMTAALERLAQQRAQFERLGKIGIFEDLALIGVDFDKINAAKSEVEAMYVLADQISKLDRTGQLMAADILGLSPQTLDLLKQGSAGVKDLSNAYQSARPHTAEMANVSRELVSEWNMLIENVGGRADKLSVPIVGAIASITASTNDWFEANRAVIDQNMDKAIEAISENFDVLAPAASAFVATGVLATFAGLAKHVPIVGGAVAGMAGGLAKMLPLVGAIAVAFEAWDWTAEDIEKRFGFKPPEWLFKTPGELFKDWGNDWAKNVEPTESDDIYGSYMAPLSSVESPALSVQRSENTQTPIQTQVKIDVNMDGTKIAEAQTELVNGQIDAALQDMSITEDR